VSAPLDDRTDADLVALHRSGGQPAFAALMRRHKQPLYRLILAQTGDAEDAFDLLQETFVAAHAALARFDVDRSLRAWLARIAINKCRDCHRRRRRRALAWVLPNETRDQVADPAASVETQAVDRDALTHTLAAIARLPAALREPLLLCTIDALSQAEAAEALGVSVKTIETRVRRARRALTAILENNA
jgi:RNA polymerase sigma factor (sigma-70 family)